MEMVFNVLIIVLGAIVGLVNLISPEWKWLIELNQKIPRLKYISIIVSIFLVIGGAYFAIKTLIDKEKYSIFVSPNTVLISPGYDKKTILKLTNNNDYPIYQVDVRISVDYGDLTVDNVKTDLVDDAKMKSDIGGVVISHDMIGIGMITKDRKREDHKIIYDIDAHSTKELIVTIDGHNINKKSKVIFEVVRTSKEPADIFGFDPFVNCKLNDKSFDVYHDASKDMLNQRRYEDAIVCCQKALLKEPRSSKVHNNIGTAHLFLNNRDEAIKSFEKALVYDSSNAKSALNLAGVLMQNKEFDESIDVLNKVIDLETEEKSDIHVMKGRLLSFKGENELAVQSFKSAVGINDKSASAYYYWGVLLKDLGRFTEAIEVFDKGSVIESNYRLDIIGMLGGCLQNNGDIEGAINKYKQIILEAPDSPQATKSKKTMETIDNHQINN